MATLNVRMPEDLKRNGDRVLERNGVSVTEAIRALYTYLDREQALPPFMATPEDLISDKVRRRREMLLGIIGVADPSVTLDQIRTERLAEK